MNRYAFLLTAMSVSEAKVVLGFPPSSTPSPGDIKSAFRSKALEYHPDRGGSVEKFQEVEAANAILTGKARPSYDHRGPSSPSTRSNPQPRETYKPPPEEVVTFEEAKSKASVPGSVDWKFVTTTQKGKGWAGNESSLSDMFYVAYGRTGSKHIFVGMRHYEKADYYIGGSGRQDKWSMESYEYPIKKDEGSNPAWLYRKVVTILKQMGFEGKFNSKVIDAKDWKLSQRLPTGSKVSIKHWLVNSGEVAADSASVANRKHVIEIKAESTRDEKSGFYPEPKDRGNFWDGKYMGEYWKITLIINGKPFVLNEKDTTKFLGAKFKGKKLPRAIFGDYLYGSAKKQLSRLRDAKTILGWMTTRFEGLPKEAMEILKIVEEQKKKK